MTKYDGNLVEHKGVLKTIVLSFAMASVATLIAVILLFTVQDTVKYLLTVYNTSTYGASMANTPIVMGMLIFMVIGMVVMFFMLQHYFDKNLEFKPKKCFMTFFVTVITQIVIIAVAILVKSVVKGI